MATKFHQGLIKHSDSELPQTINARQSSLTESEDDFCLKMDKFTADLFTADGQLSSQPVKRRV